MENTTSNQKYTVTYGGWFQRTTLHLSEVHYLFSDGNSDLNLSKEKLKELPRASGLSWKMLKWQTQ